MAGEVRGDMIGRMPSKDTPFERMLDALAAWRSDRDNVRGAAIAVAFGAFLVGVNLWIALTPEGRAVWLWFAE